MTELQLGPHRLDFAPDNTRATLENGLSLRVIAALDTTEGPDETLAVEEPRLLDGEIEIERRSTIWERAATRLVLRDTGIDVIASVTGRGDLTDVHLLGGRSLLPGRPTGFLPSGSNFRTLFSPNPGDPGQLTRSAAEPAVIGVSGDGEPGRGHWFFTPAPLSLWLTNDEAEWFGISLAAPVEQLTFVQLVYVPADRGFSLRLEYEGHTHVDWGFETPAVVLTPGVADPYTGLRQHRDDLVARGFVPAPTDREQPEWWSEPLFCGWGAQGANPVAATQANYTAYLDHLEREGVVPGTVAIDDKWQATYGGNEPDPEKWPDLPGWIADRHARGQHVLLWWKAWDPEGVPPELYIRNADGAPIAFDPTNPDAREQLRHSITHMLSPDGLDADGLKVDFIARTPSGTALITHGPGWGIALLHDLLAVVYEAAKDAKPDALIITHTPHPSFVDVTDMIRLNDMLRLGDPGPRPPIVPQMRYRAEVARASAPELLIDTDDWSAPDLDQWRAYLAEKPLLGVPALYYAESLDSSGELFAPADYEALRTTWAEWRRRNR
jgi:hypothetical protein